MEIRDQRRTWFSFGTRTEEVLGDYRLGRKLGAGGIGVVRKGKHMHTGVRVAIKHVEMSEKKVKFIKREIAISRLLHHPHIVHMYDVYFEDFSKEVEMVFELVEGTALLDYIVAHGYLKEKLARQLFRQILEAVGRARNQRGKKKRTCGLARPSVSLLLPSSHGYAPPRAVMTGRPGRLQTTATNTALCTATSRLKISC